MSDFGQGAPALDELHRLHQTVGLEIDNIIAAATPPESVLHSHLTWDDTECGIKYRRIEAGNLIRRYKVTVEARDDKVIRVRAFTSVPTTDGGHRYMPTSEAMEDPATRDLVLQQALRAIAQLRRKYQALTDFDEVLRQSMQGNDEGLEGTG